MNKLNTYDEFITENVITDKLKGIANAIKKKLNNFNVSEEDIKNELEKNNISNDDMVRSIKELESKGFNLNDGISGNWDNIVNLVKENQSKEKVTESLMINENLSNKFANFLTTIGFGSALTAIGSALYVKFGMSTASQLWGAISFKTMSASAFNIPVLGLTLTSWMWVLGIGILIGCFGLYYRKYLKNRQKS
tara:strand:- start:78385 stop:78963 length:579 start_codon:yes stop_codon:yes gene_type:complete